MHTIGIVGSGPDKIMPHLADFDHKVDLWMGVDRGALILLDNNLTVTYAIGDFDSVSEEEKWRINQSALTFSEYPEGKDQSDLEIAIHKAMTLNPEKIYLFGVTGGRLDHALINIQLLLPVVKKGIRGIIIDQQNIIEMMLPGEYKVYVNTIYPYISFVPFTKDVKGLTLNGFLYPLNEHHFSWGSTLCLSNKLLSKSGTFLYEEGILLLIKSRDI